MLNLWYFLGVNIVEGFFSVKFLLRNFILKFLLYFVNKNVNFLGM